MTTLYLDLFSGISGDMFLGAMLDLGVDLVALERELLKLRVGGYHLHAERKTNGGIAGIGFNVHCDDDHSHAHNHAHAHEHLHSHHGDHSHAESRNFAQITQLLESSTLSDWVKQKAVSIFRRIADAEGKIHGLPPEQVHFHEVGAIDSIVDIAGACIALEMLGKPRVLASRVVEGSGFVKCAHGVLPVPAPATLEILKSRGVAILQCEERNELVTPTGAALLAEFVERFGPMEEFSVTKIGYGLGSRVNQSRPNVLRACLGKAAAFNQDPAQSTSAQWQTDSIAVLETNLDDINPEILGAFLEKALSAGALDVFHTPVQMKKNRPGVLLTILCPVTEADKFTELLLRETSTFGVRRTMAERRILEREFIEVTTAHGNVTLKLGKIGGKVVQVAPEFESCRRLAEKSGRPLKEIYDAALRAAPQPLARS